MRDHDSQPDYSGRQYQTSGLHSQGCKLRVELKDSEVKIKTLCGMTVLRCWLPTHWDVCFEAKGACFYPPAKLT